LVVCLALSGCVGRSRLFRPAFESPIEPQPRTIGVVLPLSGEYQALGQEVLKGIRLAVAGSKVRLVVRDSQGDGALAERAVEELADRDRVVAILGMLLPDEARRGAERAEALGVSVITFTKTEGIGQVGPYVFRDMLTLRKQAEAMGSYATSELNLKSFVIFEPDTSYGKELASVFGDAVRAHGGNVTSVVEYPPDQNSFLTEAQKLTGRYDLVNRAEYQQAVREIDRQDLSPYRKRKAMERARGSVKPVVDFQGVFIADDWKKVGLIAPALAVQDVLTDGCDAGEVAKAQRTLGRQDIPSVTLLGWNGWSSPKNSNGTPGLMERGGKYVQCSVYVDAFFADSDRPATRSFALAFRESHGGQEPTLLSAVGYESAALYRRILEREAPMRRAVFRERVANATAVSGAAGLSGFTSDGEADRVLFFLKVTPGGIVELPVASPKSSMR
jgi:branched-chain amino acid transport system substrate-binding protein